MRTTYKFYAWSSSGGAGDEWAFINVDWNYNQSGRSITITGISYGGDRYGNPGYWYVGSSMKLGVKFSDGTEVIFANGTYNFSGGNYITSTPGAGFIDKNGVVGVISDAGRACSKSHTFSGTSGGFTVWFGSTASTINAGNPQSYRQLEKTSGDNPSVTFSTPPSVNCGNTTINNPSVWRLKSGISGIDWGVGATSKSLTATVSYDFQGKHYSYTAYSSSNPGSSASIDINSYNDSEPWQKVPAGVNATVTWNIKTNIGSVSCSKSVFCVEPTGPSISSITANNPEVYRLTSSANGVTYGDYYKSTTLTAKVTGDIDGNTINWTGYSTTSQVGSASFDKNAQADTQPWLTVPDDEQVTVTWTATCNVGYKTMTATKTIGVGCMKSYNAYVIESNVNNGNPVEADLIVSNSVGSQPNKEIRRVTTI